MSDLASRLWRWKRHGESFLMPGGFFAFLRALPERPAILDLGCGNASPQRVKGQRPDAIYTGIDVGDFNQTAESRAAADAYLLAEPAAFASTIMALGARQFDAVISNHNLEHCDEPDAVLDAIAHVLRPGGCLFMAFPSEASLRFPHRAGTLNFFDDPTHNEVPNWEHVLSKLRTQFDIERAYRRYRPFASAAVGLIFEPWAAATGTLAPFAGTWSLYGFESVLWARKRNVT